MSVGIERMGAGNSGRKRPTESAHTFLFGLLECRSHEAMMALHAVSTTMKIAALSIVVAVILRSMLSVFIG